MVAAMINCFLGKDNSDPHEESYKEKLWIHIKNILMIFHSSEIDNLPRIFASHDGTEEKFFKYLFITWITEGDNYLRPERVREVESLFDAQLQAKGCIDGYSLSWSGPAT